MKWLKLLKGNLGKKRQLTDLWDITYILSGHSVYCFELDVVDGRQSSTGVAQNGGPRS